MSGILQQMIKTKAIHDTIVIAKRDTIVKVVEVLNNKTSTVPSSFALFFDEYGNFFTFLATIAAFIALFITIKASNKAAKDSRHQILIGKLEEICDLLNGLVDAYPALYYAYVLVQQESLSTPAQKILHANIHNDKWEKAISGIDLKKHLEDINRLFILINLYLGEKQNKIKSKSSPNNDKTLKFSAFMFAEICKTLVIIIKYRTLKHNTFPDEFPKASTIRLLVGNISAAISEIIDFGDNGKGYKEFRDPFFKDLLKEEINSVDSHN